MHVSQFVLPALAGLPSCPSDLDGSVVVSSSRQHEAAATMLEDTGLYRVLRRLEPRPVRETDLDRLPEGVNLGVVVDTETTGLDGRRDEIVELGMVAFTYAQDRILDVVGVFGGLREPAVPLTAHITRLTGITRELVAGRSIDAEAVDAFARRAGVVVAHNASFDRPFCERAFPVFRDLPWACSLKEVPWKELGCEGQRLGHLLADVGLFHNGHRAVDDCHALLEILALPRDGDDTAFGRLLESARSARFEICAQGSPYSAKDLLKARGYRWCDGSDGWPKSWRIDVVEAALESELRYLRETVYRSDFEVPWRRLDASTRYK